MPRSENLTCCEKAYIHGGMTKAQIARKLKKDPQTIYAVFRRAAQPPSEEPKKPVGRQPKLSERDARGYTRYARTHKTATLDEIRSSGPSKVGKDVVRRALHKAGYHSRAA
ncbi:hypothetical protein MBANPS3_001359 [Mucor bainieri]